MERVMFERNRNKQPSNSTKEEARVAPQSPTMGTPPPVSSRAAAVIGPGVEISGDVNATADLVINGKIKGSIVQGSHTVEIGESGQVIARVRAKLVKVSGEVRGDIIGDEKVMITRTGRALGNIAAPRVQLDDGALFKGSIDMTPAEAAKPAIPAAEKPSAAPTKAPASASTREAPASNPAPGSSVSKDQERKEPSLTLKSG
jgi:cytoskeletal protein CcmA (bactofilin family)